MAEDPEVIQPAWVVDQVARVQAAAGDPEAAHGLEDALHKAVLQAIAEDRAVLPRVCASLALMTKAIKFPRWSA